MHEITTAVKAELLAQFNALRRALVISEFRQSKKMD